jgi:hypothetical protein
MPNARSRTDNNADQEAHAVVAVAVDAVKEEASLHLPEGVAATTGHLPDAEEVNHFSNASFSPSLLLNLGGFLTTRSHV